MTTVALETWGPSQETLKQLWRIVFILQEYAISQVDTGSRMEFCKVFLDETSRMFHAKRAWVWAWNENKSALQLAASSETDSTDFPDKNDPAHRAYASRQAVLEAASSGATVVAVPLMAQSAPLGVIQFELDRPLGEELKAPLRLLTAQAASILTQFQRFENLQMFHIEMVETLYRTVNTQDPHASYHATQTRQRARGLAMAMGLPESMARHVEYAALLRGVGKIGIDKAILNKPGKLTAEEYEKIKKHTTIGHQILANVKLLAPAAKMVLYHQEWYDGRGYPEGLKGDAIPLGARIIAVISAWEAMTSHRPYRSAMSPEEAMAELTRTAGTQFDPAVVEAFRNLKHLHRIEPPAPNPPKDPPA